MLTTLDKVLIVEDHPDAAALLEQVVASTFRPKTITMASSIAAGKLSLINNKFDLALIDLGLPDGSGLEFIRLIVDQDTDTLVIVTTIFDDEFNLFEALRAGANGYLLKGHSGEELVGFLKDAIAGHLPLSPSIAQSVLAYFRQSNCIAESQPIEYTDQSLTDREIEILVLIAKGYKVKEVSDLLQIASNTVSVHIKSIYRKLNLHNRAEATAVAVSMNLYNP